MESFSPENGEPNSSKDGVFQYKIKSEMHSQSWMRFGERPIIIYLQSKNRPIKVFQQFPLLIREEPYSGSLITVRRH